MSHTITEQLEDVPAGVMTINTVYKCSCGDEFEYRIEAENHRHEFMSEAEIAEDKMLTCVTRGTHHPMPAETLYEARNVRGEWVISNADQSMRNRVTGFYCPSCKWHQQVDWRGVNEH